VVLADRDQIPGSEPEVALLADAAVGAGAEAVDPAGAVVAEDVVAEDLASPDPHEMRVADDVAAGHGAARAVPVGDRRGYDGPTGSAAQERGEGVEGGPAEVGAPRVREGQVVDLLEAVLAAVGDGDRPGEAVERHPPRVAEAIGPDLRTPLFGGECE